MYLLDGIGFQYRTTALLDAEGMPPTALPQPSFTEVDERFAEIATDYAFADEALPYIEQLEFNEETLIRNCLANPASYLHKELLALSNVYKARQIDAADSSIRIGTRNRDRNGIDLDMRIAQGQGEPEVSVNTTLQKTQLFPVRFAVKAGELCVSTTAYSRSTYHQAEIGKNDPRRERLLGELAGMLWVTNMSLLWSDTDSRAPRDRQAKELLTIHREQESWLPAAMGQTLGHGHAVDLEYGSF